MAWLPKSIRENRNSVGFAVLGIAGFFLPSILFGEFKMPGRERDPFSAGDKTDDIPQQKMKPALSGF
jgi:hypothetical protein